MGWYFAGFIWFLGGFSILMVESSHGTRYVLKTKIVLMVIWPFLVTFTVLMWLFQLISSRRVG